MFPTDYFERVYAGVLGKIIGVYLGRPFEGWLYRDILEKLGQVEYYVNDRLNAPLVVTDDDISGTFTFLRALEDYGNSSALTPVQIGQTWLNYIIDNRTILWWGGMGMSTEHTAFLRMKKGVMPPESGSIQTNGQVVAEQIGAQIFIDGWGLIHPGDPEEAADYARRAGSVSHDGEAIFCAQVIAASVAAAFVESDITRMLDAAVAQIPRDCLTTRLIEDVRNWHAMGLDWKQGFEKIESQYGYDKYGGNCHTIPNHAIIIHALMHGQGDFQKSLMIANTCGWDTDCNSGNVGCIMGVRNGLAGIDIGPDWRGPIADKIYLPTSDGGRCVTDAANESVRVLRSAYALKGVDFSPPKSGSRFHFELPGSVQGFRAVGAQLSNVLGHSTCGHRSLKIEMTSADHRASVLSETFPTPEARKMGGYELVASPTLYPGQTVRALLSGCPSNKTVVVASICIQRYGSDDQLHLVVGSAQDIRPGEQSELTWEVPDCDGYPISEVGLRLEGADGTAFLDLLTWDGSPRTTFTRVEGTSWRNQWVNGVSDFANWGEPFRLIQNEGTGLIMTGTREWMDYRVESTLIPHLCVTTGIAARVQGMKRYYALELVRGGRIRLVKALDGIEIIRETSFDWDLGDSVSLAIEVFGTTITAFANDALLWKVDDKDRPLESGGIGLVLQEGRVASHVVSVRPLTA